MNTRDLNETLRSLNVGLPDDVERLKAAGYYEEAIARIDAYLAEDWTMTQNSPYSQGLCPHMDVQPENPTPHGVDVLRDAMIAQREIMRRIPAEYTWSKADAIAEMQRRVKDFTPEEFEMLDRENRMDWRFVEGERRYQNRFASTLIATHADLARRQIDPPAQPDSEKERCRRLHEKMAEQGSASARITLKASVGMSDEAFAAAIDAYRITVLRDQDVVAQVETPELTYRVQNLLPGTSYTLFLLLSLIVASSSKRTPPSGGVSLLLSPSPRFPPRLS